MSPTPEDTACAASMSVNNAAASGDDRLVPPIGKLCGTQAGGRGAHDFTSVGSEVSTSKPVAGSPSSAMSGTRRWGCVPKLPFLPVEVRKACRPMPADWYAGIANTRDSPPPDPPVSLALTPWQVSVVVHDQALSAQFVPMFAV